MRNLIFKVKNYIKTHKILSVIAVIVILLLAFYIYKKTLGKTNNIQYITAPAVKGVVTQTVTGSGQISSENQLDVTSEVSGKITSIPAKVGQKVNQGDLIATLDSRDALLDLENARLSYSKLVEPAKPGDIINARNNLSKSYSDGLNSISDSFTHMPGILSGLKNLFYSREGYLGDEHVVDLTDTGKAYRLTAALGYDNAAKKYETIFAEYTEFSKTNASSTIESMITQTYNFAKEAADVLKNTQAAVNFVSVSQPDYRPSGALAAAASVNSWLGQVQGDVSSLLASRNSIASSNETLKKLLEGADSFDIKSQQLSLQQKERTYAKYFIRAPFMGIVGRIPVNVYDQAGSGTVIATLSSNKKITDIPLNEVDAVEVSTGQKAILTFDAIQGLKLEGIVSRVDLVGTASQGVVTYNVKIAFDGTDSRIRSGMSIDAAIITKEKSDILVVPSGAVKSRGVGKAQKSYVEALDSENQVIEIPIEVGESDDTNTEITGGLSEGEKIITRTLTGAAARTTAPTIFSGLGGGQRNIIRNANGR